MVQFRRDWLTRLDMMQQEMDRLLGHLAGSKPPQGRFSPSAWEPAMDVFESDGEIVVAIELAGVRESDIEMTVDRDTFTIRGFRRKSSRTSGNRAYYQMEIASGPFRRSIKLRAPIDTAKMRASYEDGLVEVVLPKAGAKRIQTLRIQARKPGLQGGKQ
jgi:HSP20 family protein